MLLCIYKELEIKNWKMKNENCKLKFLKQGDYSVYVIANYQNISKSTCRLSQISFYRLFFKNKKGPGTSLQVTFL